MTLTAGEKPRVSALRKAVIIFTVASGWGVAGAGDRARGIGALCNGQLASDPLLDASYQPGPALLEGTQGDDVIIGSQGGHDRIRGNGGDDVVCGGPGGYNSITVGPGNAVVFGGGGHERITGIGPGNFTFVGGPLGYNTLTNRGGRAVLYGGAGGHNTLIHAGPTDGQFVKMDGGAGPNNVCIIQGGDEITRCNDNTTPPPAMDPAIPTGTDSTVRDGTGDLPGPVLPGERHDAPRRSGYWMLLADGTVYGFGDAKPLGEPPEKSEGDAVHLEPTSTGAGYWIVDGQGNVSALGDARFLGAAGRPRCSGSAARSPWPCGEGEGGFPGGQVCRMAPIGVGHPVGEGRPDACYEYGIRRRIPACRGPHRRCGLLRIPEPLTAAIPEEPSGVRTGKSLYCES